MSFPCRRTALHRTGVVLSCLLPLAMGTGAVRPALAAPDAPAPVSAPVAAMDPALAATITHLDHEWARINYQVTDKDDQDKQMQALAAEAAGVVAANPARAEPLIWQAIILCSEAGYEGGIGAYHLVQTAHGLLEKAATLDYHALNGAIPVNLGILYYKVPSFPIGFGSARKAQHYLEDAIAMDPNGLDANLFYGEFLFLQGDTAKATTVLKHALDAPPSPDRPVWDAGRRQEVRDLLTKVEEKAKDDAS